MEHKICLEVSPSKRKRLGFQDTYVLVLIHVSIQYVELGFPSAIVTPPPPACTLGSTHSSNREPREFVCSLEHDHLDDTAKIALVGIFFCSRGFLTGLLVK